MTTHADQSSVAAACGKTLGKKRCRYRLSLCVPLWAVGICCVHGGLGGGVHPCTSLGGAYPKNMIFRTHGSGNAVDTVGFSSM
jgi:hypothetical protein